MSDASSLDDNPNAWFLDNGATHHTTNEPQNLSTKQDYKGKSKVIIGNGSTLPITHIGHSVNEPLIRKNILHVLNINKILLSISQFTTHNNVTLEFYSSCCLVKDKKMRLVLLRVTLDNRLYQLKVSHSKLSQPTTND